MKIVEEKSFQGKFCRAHSTHPRMEEKVDNNNDFKLKITSITRALWSSWGVVKVLNFLRV
jgi:hypothetical protein